MLAGLLEQGVEEFIPSIPAEKRSRGFKFPHVPQERGVHSEVGRVCDNDERLTETGDGLQETSCAEFDAVHDTVTLCILAREKERFITRVRRNDAERRALERDRHRNASASRADIDHCLHVRHISVRKGECCDPRLDNAFLLFS